ncbi:putative Cation-transporting ATPase 13A2 [Daphnia magna]|uniref:Cation-transporting ATPase n=1 Tax=Daphnia magna TaxID=35525 RepID=A0A0P5DRY5_9CRUS|nr:putative Cation-transporting ATPase 13A2 [Daphnia magna]
MIGDTKGYMKLNVKPSSTVIGDGSKEQLIAVGYTRSYIKTFIFHCIALLCIGLPYVLVYWHNVFGIRWQYVRCPIDESQVLVLEDVHGQTYIAKVHQEIVGDYFPDEYSLLSKDDSEKEEESETSKLFEEDSVPYLRFFVHQHVKYLWSKRYQRFQMLTGIEQGIQLCDFHTFEGQSVQVQEAKLQLHGFNTMSVDVKSYWRLLIDEVLNPFYLFEIFSCVVWTVDDYIYYAACIFVVSIVSVGIALYEIRRQSSTLKNMTAAHISSMVTVSRGGEVYENIYASRLVPGDVIVIPPTGFLVPCDAVLVAGTCIVNESVLTGESAPETKTPVPDLDEPYCTDIHKRHTLFCGTQILQTRYYGQDKVLAVVIRTGFTTAKGELVRSILYPKPIGFKFYVDSLKFVLLLFGVALCGITYCVYVYITKGATLWEIIIRACDMLTIVVPPAMPAAMTVGTVYAQSRLRRNGIFCISPPRINVCGKLKLMCFDKTGTLTEGGLEFCGVAPRSKEENVFADLVRDPALQLKQDDPVLVTLAACHTLTRIEGQLIGDPLELEMFKSTQWILEEPGADVTRYDVMTPLVVKPVTRDTFLGVHGFDFAETGFEIPYAVGIVRHFPFSSSLQRMSVVVRTLGSAHMELLCKGSPEMIRTLCLSTSVPDDFAKVLRSYTMRGFRVLALAHRILDRRLTWHQMHRMKRENMECNLKFLGLLVMHNTLKPETTPVIRQLRNANIRCVMVTGDNLLTAINVGRDCDMLPVGEKVILVTATAPKGTTRASITYSLAEMYERDVEESGVLSSSESDAMFTESWPDSVFQPMENISRMWRRQALVSDAERGLDSNHLTPRLHLALGGKTLDVIRKHFPHLLQRILVRATILARMTPDQKTKVVEEFQELGYAVGFCGDGANDCGALKAAHVGISLSDAEASVAAPFTAKAGNISCVPTIVREGRCALVTSFGVFKYMALYSLIQFISVLILYSLRTTLGDYMFLYHDLFITTTVAVLMGHTDPYPNLVVHRPRGSLLTSSNMLSLVMQIALTAAIQLGALLLLMLQPWYHPIHPDGDEVIIPCWEVTVIFSIGSFQYLILALAFSYGPPYRQPFYTNKLFLFALIVLTAFSLVLTLLPIGPLANFFQVMGINVNPFHWYSEDDGGIPIGSTRSDEDDNMYLFRSCLILLVILHTTVALFIENLVAEYESSQRPANHPRNSEPKNKYKKVEQELALEKDWPPLGQASTSEILSL